MSQEEHVVIEDIKYKENKPKKPNIDIFKAIIIPLKISH